MREKWIVKYVCSFCGKEFDSKFWCEQHEEEKHKCELCKHHYMVYCNELECALKYKGEACHFEPREKE